MIRTSLLKTAAILGLLLLGALFFRRVHVPVEQAPRDAESAAETVPAKLKPIRPEREVARFVPPKRELSDKNAFFREELANVIAEVEDGTNAMPFEFRAERLQKFVENVSTNDMASAFRELTELQKSNSTESGRDLQMRLLQRWSEFDIHAAVQALDQLGAKDRSEACKIVAAAWAGQNLAESVSWAQQLPEETDRQEALLGIAYEAAFKDPKQALVLASQMTVPPDKRDFINQAASTWAADDPETAATWAKQIEDQPLREEVLAAVATSWADKDPNAAAKLVIDSLSPGPGQDNAVVGILQRMALKDMESARVWLAQFSDGPLRERALMELNRIAERQQLVQ